MVALMIPMPKNTTPQKIITNQDYFDQQQTREKLCLRWLKNQALGVKKLIWLTALFGILNGIAIIIQMGILAYTVAILVFDPILLNQLTMPLMALVAVLVLRSALVYGQQALGFRAGLIVRDKVRGQLIEAFVQLGSKIKDYQSGELASISLEQVDALALYFSRYLPQQLIVGALPLIMLAVVFPINWLVGTILLITAPLIPLFMALVGMGANSAQRDQFLALTRMSGYFLNRLQGLATLKLFGQAEAELINIQTIADKFRQQTMSVLRIAFLSSAVLELFSALAVALVAVYVGLSLLGKLPIAPEIDFKTALFVLLLAPEFFLPLRTYAIYYHDKAAAVGAADAILTILEQGSCSVTRTIPITPQLQGHLLELRQVSKAYDGREILNNISLKIEQGEKIALVGESGAGKTTLLNLLLGFEQVDSGMIFLNGQIISRDLAIQHIAYVPQNAYLFYGTIIDNIALADSNATIQQIHIAAEAAGVIEFSQHLPKGLQTLVGERGYGLSGGQVQRIALARAFLKNADIVLLDEPTAHLDKDSKTRLLAMIKKLFNDKTVIIATHDDAVMQQMTCRLQLNNGVLSAITKTGELNES